MEIETEGISWINGRRTYSASEGDRNKIAVDRYNENIITEKHERVKTPPQLMQELLPHQKAVVKAALDLEKKRFVELAIINLPASELIIETKMGMIRDPPGTGKTLIALAICSSGIPKMVRDIDYYPTTIGFRQDFMKPDFDPQYTVTEVRTKYNSKRIIPCNLIYVSKSVLFQWEDAIKMTKLKYLMIKNVYDVEYLYKMFYHPTKTANIKTLSGYDIILIKNSKITGKFNPPELGSVSQCTRNIISVFGILFRNYTFARIFIDDFDILNPPSNAFRNASLFEWCIAATSKYTIGDYYSGTGQDFLTDLLDMTSSYNSAWRNHSLLHCFNLECDKQFLEQSTGMGQVNYYSYRFVNPNDNFMGMFKAMDTDDAKLILEALNGDALKAAGKEAGVTNASVAHIFERVLGTKYKLWEHSTEVERYIEKAKTYIKGLPSKLEKYNATETLIGKLITNIKKPGPSHEIKKDIKTSDQRFIDAIGDVDVVNKKQKDENGIALNRVIDNLKLGECPIMGTPLSESTQIIILTCCGIAISGEGASFSLKLHAGTGDKIGICPNCRSDLKSTSLLFINKNEVDDIIKINIAGDTPEANFTNKEKQKNITAPKQDITVEDKKQFDKYTCIMNIIKPNKKYKKDEEEKKQEQKEYKIPRIVHGTKKGLSGVGDKKFLIYATHGETVQLITNELDTQKIKWNILYGTATHIKDLIEKYWLANSNADSFSVLIIKGAEYCAGLNLQCVTDIIFAHKVLSLDVEVQIIGRAARIGRKYDLSVHYVLYDNEYVMTFGNKIV
jgi:hypothetical protein